MRARAGRMTIQLLIDENLDPQIAQILRTHDYEATTVSEALEPGAKDPEIAAYARRNEIVVVTNDRDFLIPELKGNIPVLMVGKDDERANEVVEAIETILEHTESRDDLPAVLWL
jgi:predicted nuclease of predicted toxin-antitoxin system